MSNSKLQFLPEPFFTGCQHLRYIDLSNNMLSHLPQGIRQSLDELAFKHDLRLDLSGNLFSCHCHEAAQGTIRWIHKSQIQFLAQSTYKCIGSHDFELILEKNLDDYETFCETKNNTWRVVSITSAACLTFYTLLIVLIVLHRYRYRIRTKLYRMLRYLIRAWNRGDVNAKAYAYDVYLTYYEKDADFLFSKVLYMLDIFENTNALTCCVPDRDFEAYGVLRDTIHNHMEQSRVILFLITKASLENPLFHFELHTALHFQSENQYSPDILFIIMGNVDMSDPMIQDIVSVGKHYFWPTHFNSKHMRPEILDKIVLKITKRLTHSVETPSNNEVEMEFLAQ